VDKVKKKKVNQSEDSLERKKQVNIKAIKYPIILNKEDRDKLDNWMRIGKEFYNLLNEQQRAVEL
jgi:hypothetical protein